MLVKQIEMSHWWVYLAVLGYLVLMCARGSLSTATMGMYLHYIACTRLAKAVVRGLHRRGHR
jgi:hypothetical protein